MSATDCLMEQSHVPCCCTVAQAARNGHYEHIKHLISTGRCIIGNRHGAVQKNFTA